jgi:ABC-type glycerol-3-phosphate transport system permease component
LIVSATLIPGHVILGPIYTLWSNIGLTNNFQGVILIEMIMSMPYATIILKSFFEKIPRELVEAAQIEGCSYWSLFFRIVLPVSVPALISAFILEFTYVWNDFVWPLILTPSEQYHTMTLGILQLSGQYVNEWHLMAAAAIISSLPPLILFFVFQKYFIKGILGGSFIKG